MICTTLRAYLAMFMSWVIMMMVRPSSFSSRKRPITCLPVFWSSAPVGSSASNSVGLPTNALAMATRCCWPPDSWLGVWPMRSDSPTRSSISRARRRRSRTGTPA